MLRLILRRSLYLIIILLLGALIYPKGYFVLKDSFAQDAFLTRYEGTNAYIINLDRSKDRYSYVAPQVERLGYRVERVSGVDGSKLSENELKEKTDFESYKMFLGHYPKRGTIGCSLSHLKAWKIFLDSNAEFAIIFEDDVSFDPNELKKTIEILKNNSALWDVVTFEISHRGMPLTLKRFDETNNNLSIYLTEVTHAGAYLIKRDVARKMIEKFLPIKMPIDYYFTRAWEFDIKYTGVEPRIVHQTYGDSNINATTRYSDENDETQDLVSMFNRGVFKLQSYIIRFFYNLKIYLSLKLSIN